MRCLWLRLVPSGSMKCGEIPWRFDWESHRIDDRRKFTLLEKCGFDVSFVFFALEFSGHFVFEWFWMHIQRRYIGLRVLKLWPWPWIQNSPTLSGVPVSTDKHGGGYIHRYTLKLVGGLEHFFSIIYGIILPIDFHIFQRGCNHQPGRMIAIPSGDFTFLCMFGTVYLVAQVVLNPLNFMLKISSTKHWANIDHQPTSTVAI